MKLLQLAVVQHHSHLPIWSIWAYSWLPISLIWPYPWAGMHISETVGRNFLLDGLWNCLDLQLCNLKGIWPFHNVLLMGQNAYILHAHIIYAVSKLCAVMSFHSLIYGLRGVDVHWTHCFKQQLVSNFDITEFLYCCWLFTFIFKYIALSGTLVFPFS